MRYDEFTVGYRSEDLGATIRLEGLLERRGSEAQRASISLGGLYARRAARSAAGIAIIVGFMLMVAEAARTWLATRTFAHAPPLLLASWALGALAYVVTYGVTRARFAEALIPLVDLGHGPRADVERLEAVTPDAEARARIDRWEQRSVALPLTGLALLLPLTIHAIVWMVVSLVSGRAIDAIDFASFGEWMGVSLLIVGHCHLVLVYLAHRAARTMRGLSTWELSCRSHSGWSAYGWTILSTLPVAILYLVPTILVALTGLLFIPATFAHMRRRVLIERALLAGPAVI